MAQVFTVEDTKGWNGAEWGMTPQQVEAATKLHLTQDKAPPPGFGTTCHQVVQAAIGDWKADVSFCFEDAGPSLTSITVALGDQVVYETLRDDLKSKYGKPISETQEVAMPGVLLDETTWLLPSTEVRCMDSVVKSEHHVGLSYNRRSP